MPGWITLQQKPIYTIKSQLGQWRKLRRMQVATGGQRGIKSYFSHAPRTRAARSATTPDEWVSRGCYGSHVTGGHGCSADGNGGYGQPVATAGPRAHDRAEGQATPPARRRRPRRRNERIPGPDRYRLRLCRPRRLRRLGRTAEGDHGRTSGSDDGYGRIVEAAADGG